MAPQQDPSGSDAQAGAVSTSRASEVAEALFDQGRAPLELVRHADHRAQRLGLRSEDIFYFQAGFSRRELVEAQGQRLGAQLIDPLRDRPDPELIARFGADRCLRHRVLPWRRIGGSTIILTSRSDAFRRCHAELSEVFGEVRVAMTTGDQMEEVLTKTFGPQLIHRAETRVPAEASCRNWSASAARCWGVVALALLGLALAIAPVQTLAALIGLTVILLALNTLIRLAAALRGPGLQADAGPHDATLARLPVISLLVPLYREREIADHLLSRLEEIDYPRELLDVCLVMEQSDTTTRVALGRARLLTWMRLITVPDGTIKTKPRALNYALDFTRGSIIGVYDAEDAPAPNQLRRVAHHFANAGPQVACLQGMLDYYNSSANWLTRCFTIEYATWFRVVLPGYARLGLIVPLGGTTLFFRRRVLEELGGWDAHNVTEDADLGVRLARRGYRTEFIASVTEEEANGRVWPWVKQRSRWLKGYAVTYGVHMRNPVRLWREVGAWRFFGLQVLFIGTLAQFTLSPLLWSFWLVPFGVPHPVAVLLPGAAFWALAGVFIATEVVHLALAALALKRAGKLRLWPWAITMQLYYPLATFAVYKGFLELAWRPFFWDKTAHGVLLPDKAPIQPPRPLPRPTAVG